MARGKVVAVVGGQWGSEAKGLVVAHAADKFDVHIRTGGPNAGHTIWHKGAEKFYVGRSIPCGWINPEAALVIGPGAVMDLDVLDEELHMIQDDGYLVAGRLYVDANAGVITPAQHAYEGGIKGYAHEAIGSTGEGVGITRIARINRESILPYRDESGMIQAYQFKRAKDYAEWFAERGIVLTDTATFVNRLLDNGSNILLEGTQGSGLSMIHGEWPYCTSADTNAGQLAVDAGISPSLVDETVVVCRTFPIRVAGNSGPMGEEISFEDLGVPEETTTVTKKVRRIAKWSDEVVARAVMLNRPAALVITFMNYLFPDDPVTDWDTLTGEQKDWLWGVMQRTGGEIVGVSSDPINLVTSSRSGSRWYLR